MTETIQTQLDDLRALRLPDLQARFAELVGEETRCPNKAFLLRRIGEALEARAAEASPAEDVTAEAATSTDDAPAPDVVTADAPLADAALDSDDPHTDDEGEGTEPDGARLQDLDVEQLRARYLDVVGRGTGSDDRRYVELGDMWSWAPARRVLPRRAREATPHNRAAFSGGMTLRFPRPEACMATGAASWRSQGERA